MNSTSNRLSALSRWFILMLGFVAIPSFLVSQQTDWAQLIESWRESYHVPGMAVGIVYNDQIILSEGFGVLEEGKHQKVDQHTLFAIASNTKAFITASMASLVADGRLNWDDPVRNYLPYFELYDPCVSEMTTIRDLLCHRIGLGTFSGDVIWYRSNRTAEEVVRHASGIPQAFQFRNGFGYSNVMYIAAGEVIRAVTGQSWSDYVKEHILRPLHMDRTVTSTTDLSRMGNVATPHHPDGEQNEPIDWVEWGSSGAAGGIISSSDDMLKWINLQLHNGTLGNETYFNRQEQLQMWTPHVNFPVSDRTRELYGGRNFNGYGLGWGTSEYNGRMMVSHTGGYDGMYSAVVLLPTEKIGIVVLTNSMRSIGTMLANEILDRLLELPPRDWKERGIRQDKDHMADRASRITQRTDARHMDAPASLTMEQVIGLYRCPMYGDIRIIESEKQLVIDFDLAPGLRAKLTHWHDDTYRLDWVEKQAWFSFGTVQIQKDNNQQPVSLLFDVPNDDIFFEEIHAVRVKS